MQLVRLVQRPPPLDGTRQMSEIQPWSLETRHCSQGVVDFCTAEHGTRPSSGAWASTLGTAPLRRSVQYSLDVQLQGQGGGIRGLRAQETGWVIRAGRARHWDETRQVKTGRESGGDVVLRTALEMGSGGRGYEGRLAHLPGRGEMR